jgi:hypothetical protein
VTDHLFIGIAIYLKVPVLPELGSAALVRNDVFEKPIMRRLGNDHPRAAISPAKRDFRREPERLIGIRSRRGFSTKCAEVFT